MSVKFSVLGSSSKGNCYLIQTEYTNLLVDAGFSSKRIIELLATKSLSVHDINGVFITHEHSDHSTGIRGLSKLKEIELFANHLTAEMINKRINKQINWNILVNEQHFQFRDLDVVGFSLPHDAADPIGYKFTQKSNNSSTKICIATDLGYIPYNLPHYTNDANLLILESNHDLHMLEIDTKRPVYIKNRIRGKYGHLSNNAAATFITNYNTIHWKHVLLTHLSHDCNSVYAVQNILKQHKLPEIFSIQIVDPNVQQYQSITIS